jgi:hypothetical protein
VDAIVPVALEADELPLRGGGGGGGGGSSPIDIAVADAACCWWCDDELTAKLPEEGAESKLGIDSEI